MMVLRAAAGVLAAGAAAVTISVAASAVPSDSPVAIFESGQVRRSPSRRTERGSSRSTRPITASRSSA